MCWSCILRPCWIHLVLGVGDYFLCACFCLSSPFGPRHPGARTLAQCWKHRRHTINVPGETSGKTGAFSSYVVTLWLWKPSGKLKTWPIPNPRSVLELPGNRSLTTLRSLPSLWAEAAPPKPQPIPTALRPDLTRPFSSPASTFTGSGTLKWFSKTSHDPSVHAKQHLRKNPIDFYSEDPMIISTGPCQSKHWSPLQPCGFSHGDQTASGSIAAEALLVWSPDREQHLWELVWNANSQPPPPPHLLHQKLENIWVSTRPLGDLDICSRLKTTRLD